MRKAMDRVNFRRRSFCNNQNPAERHFRRIASMQHWDFEKVTRKADGLSRVHASTLLRRRDLRSFWG